MKEESEMIVIRIQIDEAVRGLQSLSFATESTVPLRRIFLDFCDRLDFVYGTIRFLLDGHRVKETETAKERGISDGDVIDAFYDQVAGAHRILTLSTPFLT